MIVRKMLEWTGAVILGSLLSTGLASAGKVSHLYGKFGPHGEAFSNYDSVSAPPMHVPTMDDDMGMANMLKQQEGLRELENLMLSRESASGLDERVVRLHAIAGRYLKMCSAYDYYIRARKCLLGDGKRGLYDFLNVVQNGVILDSCPVLERIMLGGGDRLP